MTIQTVVSIDDSLYLHWQTQFLIFSMQRVKQPAPLLRLVATKDPKKVRSLDGPHQTFLTQSYCPHPITGDHYPPYNKPASLREWVSSTVDNGETLLILDPDCVFLRPILREVSPGNPIAEKMFFMEVSASPGRDIIKRHCTKNSHLAQPVGVPLLIRKSDLRTICPRWVQLTSEMREDPKTKKEIPWIAEMWAYVIAAAEAGITHHLENNQQFPTEDITDRSVIHYSYATESKSRKWKWDKRDYKPFTKVKPYPNDIPAAGKLFHNLLEQLASHYCHNVIK
jgi:hypothetical protein